MSGIPRVGVECGYHLLGFGAPDFNVTGATTAATHMAPMELVGSQDCQIFFLC